MKNLGMIGLAVWFVLCLAGCTSQPDLESRDSLWESSTAQQTSSPPSSGQDHREPGGEGENAQTDEMEDRTEMEQNQFYVTVGETSFLAVFAENPGAQALKELLGKNPVTVQLDDYGGFEKVGPLGQKLPTSNSQTTTQAGDIVLYQGDQIVLFYGSNSWSYTRLGKIQDLTGWEDALGQGSVSVTFSLTDPQL